MFGSWLRRTQENERLQREKRRHAAQVSYLQSHLGEAGSVGAPSPVSPEERQLVAAGELVAAIRAYRMRTGADLKTAKSAIESVR